MSALFQPPHDPWMTTPDKGAAHAWLSNGFDALAGDGDRLAMLARRQLAQPLTTAGGMVAAIVLAVFALLLIWPLRRWLIASVCRLAGRIDQPGQPLADTRAAIGFIITTLLIAAGVRVLRVALDMAFRLLPPVAALADTAAFALVVIGVGLAISAALRMAGAGNEEGTRARFPWSMGPAIAWFPLAGAAVLALTGLVRRTGAILAFAPVSRLICDAALAAASLAVLLAFLVAVGRSRDADTAAEARARSAGLAATTIGWAAALGGTIVLLGGDSRLALLIVQEAIWAGLVGLIAMIIARCGNAALGWILGADHAAGQFVAHVVGLGRARVDQLRILTIGVFNLAVWGLAIAFMAAPLLADRGASLAEQIRPALVIGELEGLHIAPRAIAVAIAVFAIGMVLTRLLRGWMQDCFLPTTSLDVGIRGSITTGLSYAGALAALLAAASVLGVALDKVTLIASALSVGIGFGLQSIIQNFVSGIILLIERPIKVGDWVSTAGAEGIVQRIRVRATEIAMPDGSFSIVPNSSFISAPVQNRTAAGIADRVALTLKIGGGTSAAAVRDTIMKIVAAIDTVRSRPAPRLLLVEQADGNYGFTLEAYAKTRQMPAEAKSELLYALSARLDEAGLKAALS